MNTYLKAVFLLLFATWASCATADPVADFYRGKQVTMIVSYGPGAGYDVYGRLVAKYMAKYIPGTPTVIVQNMPGAGSLKGANYIYSVAPRDGTAFGNFARNIPLLGIIPNSQTVQFDPFKFTWLGSSSDGSNDAYLLLARKDAGSKSIADLRRKDGPPLLVGSTSDGASSDATATMMRDLLGFNVKIVPGYRDGAEMYLAVERKEIEARMAGYSSAKPSRPGWFAPDSFVHVLMVMGRPTRHPDFPNVPTARELAPTDKDRQIIEVMEIPYQVSRPFAAPPEVPADRAKALQKAFGDAHRDPDFLAEAQKLKIDISPIGSDEILRLLQTLKNVSPEMMGYLQKLISE